eukprot:425414-Pleurochrysis_carterae.AAC.2
MPAATTQRSVIFIYNASKCAKVPAKTRRNTRLPICQCPELVPERVATSESLAKQHFNCFVFVPAR